LCRSLTIVFSVASKQRAEEARAKSLGNSDGCHIQRLKVREELSCGCRGYN
jgi:hypothetical protein